MDVSIFPGDWFPSSYRLWMLTWFLTLPRLLAAFAIMPFLGEAILPGFARNAIAIVLTMVAVPISIDHIAALPPEKLNIAVLALILIKEAALGMMLGYLISIPFWAISATGYFIDMQRGVMSAEMFAPIVSGQTSPLGNLLTQMMVTLLFLSGGFLMLFEVFLMSYQAWPIYDFFPTLNAAAADIFITQFGLLMYTTLLLSGPIISILFLLEMGMAIIGRYVPQINIFLLAMPIKSAVAFLMLIFYVIFIAKHLRDSFFEFDDIFNLLKGLLA